MTTTPEPQEPNRMTIFDGFYFGVGLFVASVFVAIVVFILTVILPVLPFLLQAIRDRADR